jgi:hypothetical protein
MDTPRPLAQFMDARARTAAWAADRLAQYADCPTTGHMPPEACYAPARRKRPKRADTTRSAGADDGAREREDSME